ncbi:MAG TPA: hypothetical protein VMD59_09265, partial [Acidimicrobiales bacterium]|nr:hypothetical protein [Acidimicrobiales bacterium]
MSAPHTPRAREVLLCDDVLELRVQVGADGVARLVRLAALAGPTVPGPAATRRDDETSSADRAALAGLPLVDVVTAGSGRAWSGHRYVESSSGGRLRYAGSEVRSVGTWRELSLCLEDSGSGLRAEVVYRLLEGHGVLRSTTRVANAGPSRLTLESVTSFVASGLAGPCGELDDVEIWWAENDWLSENRWQRRMLRDALPDLDRGANGSDSRAMFGLTSEGGWSSGGHLPMGAAVNRRTGHAWLWQIEHNGGWHWQVGEHTGRDAEHPGATGRRSGRGAAGYLALLGPTDAEHHWRLVLEPGESFETVPVAIAVDPDGFEGALARMTACRRAVRRPHTDHERLPVIYNDYMNTLMGDPTTARLLPLIEAAS